MKEKGQTLGRHFAVGLVCTFVLVTAVGQAPTAWAAVSASSTQVSLPRCARTLSLYHDGRILNSWQDWSWAPHALAVPAPAGGPAQAMQVNFANYSGIFLHSNKALRLRNGYVEMLLNGGSQGGQRLAISFVSGKASFGHRVDLNTLFAQGLPPNHWVGVIVRLHDSLLSGVAATGVVLQDTSGILQPSVYVGSISLCEAS